MNDDFYDDDVEKLQKLYEIAEKAFNEINDSGIGPMDSFGVIMGMVAKQFMKYGWKREDFIDFLTCIQETEWPDNSPKKPKLTLVKK